MPKQDVDSLLFAPYLITMADGDRAMRRDAAIAVKDGRIFDVASREEISLRYQAPVSESFDDRLLMPGMVNAHGHAPMVCYRGKLPSDARFEDVLFTHMLPLERDFCGDARFVYLSTRLAAAEMLSGGVTTSAEMYYHARTMARAFREMGMRGIIGETVMTDRNPLRISGEESITRTIEATVSESDDLIEFAIAPHAPYTADDRLLLMSSLVARMFSIPLLMHANETHAEVTSLYGETRPAARDPPLVDMHEKGLLDYDRITLAHCNYLSPMEIVILKNQGIGVAHNPVCNAGIGIETCDAVALQSHGIPVAIATDGPMTNDRLDLLSQLKPTQLLHRMRRHSSGVLSPYELVRMVTSEAARALHRDDIGAIERGRWADIAVIDVSSPAAQTYLRYAGEPYSYLVNHAQRSSVAGTIVGGKRTKNADMTETVLELAPFVGEIAAWVPK